MIGTTPTPQRIHELQQMGVKPALINIFEPATFSALPDHFDVLVHSVPPVRMPGSSELKEGTENLLAYCQGRHVKAFLYLSSTSVYGPQRGEWVDEDTPCRPASPHGKARFQVERKLIAAYQAWGLPVMIFRLSAIYGPGRTTAEKIRNGTYQVVAYPGEPRRINRIHVEDIVAVLLAALKKGRRGQIYLLADDYPSTAEEYAYFIADLIDARRPPTIPYEEALRLRGDRALRPMESKRCKNDRIKRELGVTLKYPTFREGIVASLS